MAKLSVIYYSATGHGAAMAKRVGAAAEAAGAEVRIRHVAETRDPASFAQNPAWTAHYETTKDLPVATGDDIVWADAVIFGSPTRFGSVASAAARLSRLARRHLVGGQARRQGLCGVHVDQHRPWRPGDDDPLAVHHADALRRHHRAARVHGPVEVRRRKPLRRSLTADHGNISEFDGATNDALDHLAKRVVSIADRLTS